MTGFNLQSNAARVAASGVRVATGLALAAVFLGGCAPESGDERAFSGTVVEVDRETNEIVLEVESGADFLEERHVRVSARSGDIANAEPGARIRAILADAGSGETRFRLERVWPAEEDAERIVEHLNRRLREDTVIRGDEAYRLEGEALPRFALYDQFGRLARPERFEGKRVVMNFIFTRCADPQMCPAATQRMAQLQDAAGEAGVSDFELVSVTLDPAYDTPGVLREYATARDIDPENFSFLTGPERAVRDLMTQMGVLTEPDDENYLNHTMATLLIDETGTIVHRVDGSQWLVSDFLNRLKEEGGDA